MFPSVSWGQALIGAVFPRRRAFPGHSDRGFTLRVYTHLMPEAADRMRWAVDRVLSGEADGPATAQGDAL